MKEHEDLPTGFVGEAVAFDFHLLSDSRPNDAFQLTFGDDRKQQIFVCLVIPRLWAHGDNVFDEWFWREGKIVL